MDKSKRSDLLKPKENYTEPKVGNARSIIELPKMEGDTQIYLGQSIVTLVRLAIENNTCYAESMQHSFKVELMASVLEELNISLSDLAQEYKLRNEVKLNPEV